MTRRFAFLNAPARRAGWLGVVLLLWLVSPAAAQTLQYEWDGGGDGTSWEDSDNWNPDIVPEPWGHVEISHDSGTSYTIVVSGTQEVASITQTSSRATLQVDGQLTVSDTFEQAEGSVSGAGTLMVDGTYTLAPSGIFTSLSTATIVLDGGLTWSDGDISGAGTITINGASAVEAKGCILDPPVSLQDGRWLELNATMTITAGCISPESGATFVVEPDGVVDFRADDTGIRPDVSNTELPTLVNRGLITKTDGEGSLNSATIGYLNNNGLILENTGTIRSKNGTVRLYVSEGSDTGGLYEMDGGNLAFYRADRSADDALAITGTVQGDGFVQAYDALSFSGLLDIEGALLMQGQQALDAELTIDRLNTLRVATNRYNDDVFAFNTTGAQTVDTLSVQGRMALNTDLTIAHRFDFGVNDTSIVTGTGDLTIPSEGVMTWGIGTMGERGTLRVEGTLESTAAMYLDGDWLKQDSYAVLNGRALEVAGSVVWDDAPLTLDADATVEVLGGGTFDFARDGTVISGEMATGAEQFTNAGTVTKSGVGQRTSTGDDPVTYDDVSAGMPIEVPVVNSGTLSLEAGRTAFTDALISTGRIQGTDTLDATGLGAPFDPAGVVGPGTSPGALTVLGSADLREGTLAIEIDGTEPATEHDQLRVSGAMTLGGTLDVTLPGAFIPSAGDQFVIATTSDGFSGAFDTIDTPALDDGKSWQLDTQGAVATLEVVQEGPSNEPPVAVRDTATTLRNQPVTIDVLANDTDPDGNPLSIADVTTPELGTATVSDGTIEYVPNDGVTGEDAFVYTVVDGQGGTDEGRVAISIRALGFNITALGTLGGATSKALAVNDAGRIVGVSTTEGGAVRAFTWDDGVIAPLSAPEAETIHIFDVNNEGAVVGTATRDSVGEAFRVDPDDNVRRLGTLGGSFSAGHAVNEDGVVVGAAATRDDAYHAFRWSGAMDDLGTFGTAHSEAFGINDAGTVVGTITREDGTSQAFVGTTVLDDGPAEGRAYAISETERVTGSALEDGQVVAYTWQDGTAAALDGLGGDFAEAYAVNDVGLIVGTAAVAPEAATAAKTRAVARRVAQWKQDGAAGWRRGATLDAASETAKLAGDDGSYHAVLWADGEPHDLNDLVLDPEDEWTLIEARQVNSTGWIVGYGRYHGALRGFLLTPADNAPPQAGNDIHRVREREAVVLDVLANDRDADGHPLRVLRVLDRPAGVVALTADSTAITYTPADGFSGTDTFRYLVGDGHGSTARASVEVEVDAGSVSQLQLHPNYPNPFRTRTTIRYDLPDAARVRLAVYDVLGRQVATLADGRQPAGDQEHVFDASRLTSGAYFVRLTVGSQVLTRRITVVR